MAGLLLPLALALQLLAQCSDVYLTQAPICSTQSLSWRFPRTAIPLPMVGRPLGQPLQGGRHCFGVPTLHHRARPAASAPRQRGAPGPASLALCTTFCGLPSRSRLHRVAPLLPPPPPSPLRLLRDPLMRRRLSSSYQGFDFIVNCVIDNMTPWNK